MRQSDANRKRSVAKRRKKLPLAIAELRLIPIPFADEIHPGDSVAEKLLASLRRLPNQLQPGDILVVKHKIVSKAEGRVVELRHDQTLR